MRSPNRGAHVIVKSAYPGTAPEPVRVWEQQIGMAATPEDAQTQMLYAIAVETHKLRVTVQWAIIWLAALAVLGLIIWVLAIVAA